MAWRHYEKGFLWRAGGIGDQPANVMQAIEILSAQDAHIVRRKMEKKK